MTDRAIDIVRLEKSIDNLPIVVPQREEVVSLCVILNELAYGKLAGFFPKEIKLKHEEEKSFDVGSEDGSHEIIIAPRTTTLKRYSCSIEIENNDTFERTYKVEFEREFETEEILKIVYAWDKCLYEVSGK